LANPKSINNTSKKKEEQKLSRFCTIRTMFKDGDALIAALMETGKWQSSQIEIHETPQHLYGYHGDQREEVAHVIIRRQHVGDSSNDIGFFKDEDGCYQGIISEFDSRKYGKTWTGKLKGNYAYHTVCQQATRTGRTATRERMPNGRQRITVTGYR
jgi:hypothetical protein